MSTIEEIIKTYNPETINDNEAKELYDGLLELAKLCIDSHCKIYLAIE